MNEMILTYNGKVWKRYLLLSSMKETFRYIFLIREKYQTTNSKIIIHTLLIIGFT